MCACGTSVLIWEIKRTVLGTSISIITTVHLTQPAIPCIFVYQFRLKVIPSCQDAKLIYDGFILVIAPEACNNH